MSDQSLRERLMENAYCCEFGRPPSEISDNERDWRMEVAGAQIAEFINYLSANGLAIVPVEATRDMHAQWVLQSSWPNSWRALLKAAPPAAELCGREP